jgi:hypothetical protein
MNQLLAKDTQYPLTLYGDVKFITAGGPDTPHLYDELNESATVQEIVSV